MTFMTGAMFILLLVQACGPPQSNRRLPDRIDSLIAAHPAFNGIILAAENGKPLFHKAIGFRDYESRTPLDTATLFELASVSKQFTTMVIMMLKEEGKLSYDDPLEKYVPGLPYSGITIRHLLHHTSGLPDYMAVMDAHWDKSKVAGNQEIIQYLRDYHPDKKFIPGSKYEYSNTGYVLLASIAENASGKNFIALCRDRIFHPLGMTSTDIRSPEEKKAVTNFARGYIFVPEKNRYISADSFPSSNYIVWLGNRKGPGRISSTTTDLLLWDRALYSNQLISQETLREAYTPYKLNNDSISSYGFGWNIKSAIPGGKTVYHTGSNPGYATIIIRCLDSDKTIIRLCNNNYKGISEIDKALSSIMNIDRQRSGNSQ